MFACRALCTNLIPFCAQSQRLQCSFRDAALLSKHPFVLSTAFAARVTWTRRVCHPPNMPGCLRAEMPECVKLHSANVPQSINALVYARVMRRLGRGDLCPKAVRRQVGIDLWPPISWSWRPTGERIHDIRGPPTSVAFEAASLLHHVSAHTISHLAPPVTTSPTSAHHSVASSIFLSSSPSTCRPRRRRHPLVARTSTGMATPTKRFTTTVRFNTHLRPSSHPCLFIPNSHQHLWSPLRSI